MKKATKAKVISFAKQKKKRAITDRKAEKEMARRASWVKTLVEALPDYAVVEMFPDIAAECPDCWPGEGCPEFTGEVERGPYFERIEQLIRESEDKS